jgi:hypothetical protein
VYWVSAAILTIGAIVFTLFASSVVQPWATTKPLDDVLCIDEIYPITKSPTRLSNNVAPVEKF